MAAFRWAYAFVHLPAGYLADRVSLRLIYAAAVGLWSTAGAAAAFICGGRQLLATRAVLGVGEAFNWPCATRIIADLLPPEDRGLGSGIFNSGAAVGSLIAPLLITPLAIHFGWRTAFFTIGAIGFLWVLLWLAVTRKASVRQALVASRPSGGPRPFPQPGVLRLGQWAREVLLHPAFWMLLVMGLSVNPCWYFLNEWIPKYMHDQRRPGLSHGRPGHHPHLRGRRSGQLAERRADQIAYALRLVAAEGPRNHLDPGRPVDRPHRVDRDWPTTIWLIVAILGLAGMGITSFVANYTACSQDFSFANVGIVSGIMGMSCNVFAASVNPWIGRYVDATGKYTLIFILMGILPVVSLAAVLMFDAIDLPEGRIMREPDDRRAAPGVAAPCSLLLGSALPAKFVHWAERARENGTSPRPAAGSWFACARPSLPISTPPASSMRCCAVSTRPAFPVPAP